MACQNCESVALTMTSIRLLDAGAFDCGRVGVGTNRGATRTPMVKVTRAIAATVESVKGVLKNLDIPYLLLCAGCLYTASQHRWIASMPRLKLTELIHNAHASTVVHASFRGYLEPPPGDSI